MQAKAYEQADGTFKLKGWYMDGTIKRPVEILKNPARTKLNELKFTIVDYVAPVPKLKTQFNRKEWLAKFTATEKAFYFTLLTTDAEVIALDHELMASDYIDINDPDTTLGLDLLIAKGVITAARKAKMLTPEAI